MSDVHFWGVTVLAPTSGNVSFRETAPVIGTIIHADFEWNNAVLHWVGECYACMYIYDPNNLIVAAYDEPTHNVGSKTLSYVADIPGTWKAEISIWDGDEWLTLTDTVLASGPYMILSAASVYHEGPFIAQTMQVICDIHTRNAGNAAAQVHIGLYEYPGTAAELRIGYLYTGSVVYPGSTVNQVFELIVPGTVPHTWPLGVKVWGDGETEPSFGTSGAVGKAVSLGINTEKRPPLESEAKAILNAGRRVA